VLSQNDYQYVELIKQTGGTSVIRVMQYISKNISVFNNADIYYTYCIECGNVMPATDVYVMIINYLNKNMNCCKLPFYIYYTDSLNYPPARWWYKIKHIEQETVYSVYFKIQAIREMVKDVIQKNSTRTTD